MDNETWREAQFWSINYLRFSSNILTDTIVFECVFPQISCDFAIFFGFCWLLQQQQLTCLVLKKYPRVTTAATVAAAANAGGGDGDGAAAASSTVIAVAWYF